MERNGYSSQGIASEDIFDDPSYGESYLEYRWFPDEVFDRYYALMFPERPTSTVTVLDLGCGTGQFSCRLAAKLSAEGADVEIDAIDLSGRQLELLMRKAEELGVVSYIHTVQCDLMEFESDRRYSHIVCSEVVHLVPDLASFCERVCTLLAKDGRAYIRTASPHQITERSSYDFFPRCRYLDLLRNKGPELIESAFALAGKTVLGEHEVDESYICPSGRAIALFRSRPFSTLRMLDEDEFREGIERLAACYSQGPEVLVDFWMTLYVVGDKQ